jgi:hypothetical protein
MEKCISYILRCRCRQTDAGPEEGTLHCPA